MTLNIDRHKTIFVDILQAIYRDTSLAPFLAFKGDTAALLYYDLPRFSVDLDFDLLDPLKEEYVFESVQSILQKIGTIKEASKKQFGLFFKLSYDGKTTTDQNVKIDINKRAFASNYEILHYLGIPMKVMVKEDMVAHKLVAMYERLGRANRDLFDVWFFLKNRWPVNKKIVEQRTNLSYKDFLTEAIESLRKMQSKYILDGLGEVLTDKQKVWVKNNLVEEVIFYLRLALEHEAAE